jgi:hypothetical protein
MHHCPRWDAEGAALNDVNIRAATSVRSNQWRAAGIYPNYPAPSFTVNCEQADMLGSLAIDSRRSREVTPPFLRSGQAASARGMRLTSMEAGGAGYVARQPISGVGRIRSSWIFSSFSGILHVRAVAFLGY